jgi:DNA ligase-1
MSRDFVGDLAETVALLWPKRVDQPAEIDDGTLRIGAGGGAAEKPRAGRGAGVLARMLDHLDASGATLC